MIKPTVGCVVLFTPSVNEDFRYDKTQPFAAIVTYVWNDRLVNLVTFDGSGASVGKTSVNLLQDGDKGNESGYYCEWMPYQIGQAAKYEEATVKLADIGRERR